LWAQQLVGPGVFEEVDAPAPEAGDLLRGQVLVRMRAGGICGSDIPKYCFAPVGRLPAMPPPGYPMHEMVGDVVASRHAGLDPDDRVVGWAARSDALAELVVTDGTSLLEPDHVHSELTAVLCQPLACALEALDRVQVEDRSVAVLGLGPMGAILAHLARSRGARSVVGVDPLDRRDRVAQLGLDEVVVSSSTAWADDLPPDDRPEVTIEAVGHQTATFADAVRATAVDGTVLCFGINDEPTYPLDMESLIRKHLTVLGGVTRHRQAALRAADAHLIAHPWLYDVLVTHEFGRDEAATAYESAAGPRTDRMKVLISFD
jgi:L-iditol 2-dehydrogenase